MTDEKTEPKDTLVLVSGASGFVGSHCVLQLLKAGYKVRGTVRNPDNAAKTAFLRNICPEAQNNLELVKADLLEPTCWKDAVAGVDYVLHVASPFPLESPQHEDELIRPAVEGTLNVLKAIAESAERTVRRVVVTSSIAAVSSGHENRGDKPYTEDDWSVEDKCEAYPKSKTLAEKAAWDYLAKLPNARKFEMCTINPSFVLGPVLSKAVGSSQVVIKRIMEHDMPALPQLSLNIVDVRDVALAHIRAMTAKLPELPANSVVGHRFIVHSQTLWFAQVANVLHEEFESHGYDIPTTVAPSCLLYIVACWDPQARNILPRLGRVELYQNTKASQVLGIRFRPAAGAIIDAGYALIHRGIVENKLKESDQLLSTDHTGYNAI